MSEQVIKKLKKLAKRICPDGSIVWDDFEKLGRNVLAMRRIHNKVSEERDRLIIRNRIKGKKEE